MDDQRNTEEWFDQLVRTSLELCPIEVRKRVLNRESEYNLVAVTTHNFVAITTDYEKLYYVILNELINNYREGTKT